MSSVLLSVALIAVLAAFLCVHAWLALGLIEARRPRWHGLLVLLPPLWWLAPYWGYKAGLRGRTWGWFGTFTAYVALRVVSAYVA